MSLYSTQLDNNLQIKFDTCYAENVMQKNKLTGEYERVSGGGESVDLPDYLRTESIEFRGTELKLNGDYLNGVDADRLLLREINDLILPVHGYSIDQLDAKVSTIETVNTTQNTKITAIETVNTTQNKKITDLETKTSQILYNPNTAISLGFTSNGMRTTLDSTGFNIYKGVPWGGRPCIRMTELFIAIQKSASETAILDFEKMNTASMLNTISVLTKDTKIDFNKKVSMTGAVESTNLTNKKMLILDSTSKELSYATIPATGGTNIKVLTHTPSIGSNLFKHPTYTFSGSHAEFIGDNSAVLKYPVEGVSTIIFDLKEAGTTFDMTNVASRAQALTFFKDDAVYNEVNGTITSEKLNLSITYVPSKNDVNSHLISVRIRPFPVFKNYKSSGDQWAMGRLIIVERIMPDDVIKQAIQLRGKFIISNHVSTGYFGELNYGWTQ